jgi:hypothetical protein
MIFAPLIDLGSKNKSESSEGFSFTAPSKLRPSVTNICTQYGGNQKQHMIDEHEQNTRIDRARS